MNQNSDDDGQEIHHNIFYGPTSVGGTQNLGRADPVRTSLRPSMASQVWVVITLAWAVCPAVAWWTQNLPEGPLLSRLTDLLHATTPYILLAGGAAVCLDAAGYLVHRHWSVAQRAITDPVTWKLRLIAFAIGGFALFFVEFMSRR